MDTVYVELDFIKSPAQIIFVDTHIDNDDRSKTYSRFAKTFKASQSVVDSMYTPEGPARAMPPNEGDVFWVQQSSAKTNALGIVYTDRSDIVDFEAFDRILDSIVRKCDSDDFKHQEVVQVGFPVFGTDEEWEKLHTQINEKFTKNDGVQPVIHGKNHEEVLKTLRHLVDDDEELVDFKFTNDK